MHIETLTGGITRIWRPMGSTLIDIQTCRMGLVSLCKIAVSDPPVGKPIPDSNPSLRVGYFLLAD